MDRGELKEILYIAGNNVDKLESVGIKLNYSEKELLKVFYIHYIMQSIKNYTDLEQSKKLAEILPLESADMYYDRYGTPNFINKFVTHKSIKTDKYQHLIPCWSLAALLGVLPDYTLQTNTDGTVFVVCESKKPMISDAYDNTVDACVAMIEKLNELKML